MKKVIIATLLFTMLHSCMGCSDSQSDMEPIPVPQEEYMASDMVPGDYRALADACK